MDNVLASKSKMIGSNKYTVSMLGARKSRAVWVRLLALLAPILGEGLKPGLNLVALMEAKGGVTGAFLDVIEVENIGAALVELPERLKIEDLEWLFDTFGLISTVTYPDGRCLPLDSETQENHFRGPMLKESMEWIAFAIQTNFSDFLGSTPAVGTPPA